MSPGTEATEIGEPANRPGLALLPLLTGLTLMLLMTLLPNLATNRHGQADHPVALLIFWAMSAGIVRGVGFIPQHAVPRLVLSGLACSLAMLLAFSRLIWLERLPWLL